MQQALLQLLECVGVVVSVSCSKNNQEEQVMGSEERRMSLHL